MILISSAELVIFFDTHAHLDDEQFDADREGMLVRAAEAGVEAIVAIGTTADSSQAVLDLATKYPQVHAAVGIQPNCCAEAQPGDWEKIRELARADRVVAIGETGLDRYWDHTPFAMQQDYFRRHIALAQELNLPFIVHMRDCGDEIVELLESISTAGDLNGVMHSYTGDAVLAQRCLDLGLYISFAGMVTYKKSQDLREIAATIPADRLLIETDSPYLSPHPKRGTRPNEPALIVHTAACLAEVRGVDLPTFARHTRDNARRLFSLP